MTRPTDEAIAEIQGRLLFDIVMDLEPRLNIGDGRLGNGGCCSLVRRIVRGTESAREALKARRPGRFFARRDMGAGRPPDAAHPDDGPDPDELGVRGPHRLTTA